MEIKSSTIWDILSILVLAATAGLLVLYGVIFLFPNNALNAFPPVAPPAVVVLPSPTSTLPKLPPTNTAAVDVLVTATIRATETSTPTLTSTLATLTPSQTGTITLTPTITGTAPTSTRTPTNTLNPVLQTQWAQTAIAKTNAAIVALTSQAKTNAVLQVTRNVQNTQTAAARLTSTAVVQTQTAQVKTQTQAVIETATAQVQTATKNAENTATAIAVTQTQIATITLVAQATQVRQATIVALNPIAYSITGGDNTAEWFISQNMAGTVNYTLNMSGYPQARAATGWWMGEVNNHFLLFSDPSALNPVNRILYTTGVTVEQISTGGISTNLLEPAVNSQDGTAESRKIVFSLATGGFGTDRNLWIVSGAGGEVTQISDDLTRDDHDPSWVIAQTSPYNGRILFVSGSTLGSENVYMMLPALSSYASATRLTFYDVSTVEINSPRWCSGYDWEAEAFIDRVVFSMRTGPTDDWDLYSIDPNEQMANGNNEAVTRLTNTTGFDELQPDWSPFCSRITYLTNDTTSGNWDIWTMANDGNDKLPLTDSANIEARPLWMPFK